MSEQNINIESDNQTYRSNAWIPAAGFMIAIVAFFTMMLSSLSGCGGNDAEGSGDVVEGTGSDVGVLMDAEVEVADVSDEGSDADVEVVEEVLEASGDGSGSGE